MMSLKDIFDELAETKWKKVEGNKQTALFIAWMVHTFTKVDLCLMILGGTGLGSLWETFRSGEIGGAITGDDV